MQSQFRALLAFLILGTLGGCGSSMYPPSKGGFVKNTGSSGAATIFGIHFEVDKPGSRGASSRVTGGRLRDPEKVKISCELTLGDVTMELKKVPGTPMILSVNGKEYGPVETGDRVAVDAKRVVKINGTVRNPSSEPAENEEAG